MTSTHFTSKRIARKSTITLNGPLNEVFPLFGPMKEQEWASGWRPQTVYSTTNLVEERMVFRTSTSHGHGKQERIWIVSKYSPEQWLIEYTVFAPERLLWITVRCNEDIPDRTTKAEITYTYTGLTQKGNTMIEKELPKMYRHDLKDWEEAINYYLKTGERLQLH